MIKTNPLENTNTPLTFFTRAKRATPRRTTVAAQIRKQGRSRPNFRRQISRETWFESAARESARVRLCVSRNRVERMSAMKYHFCSRGVCVCSRNVQCLREVCFRELSWFVRKSASSQFASSVHWFEGNRCGIVVRD